MQPDPTIYPRFSGISTFFRLPILDAQAAPDNSIKKAIVGIPFDGGCTFRSGARFGPRSVRNNSCLIRSFNTELDIYPFKDPTVDAGDILVNPFNNDQAVSQIHEQTSHLLSKINKLIFIGGDHTISYPVIRALHDFHNQPISLIHFDSHMDTWDQYFGEKNCHGTPFKRCWEENLLLPNSSIHVGLRGPINDKQDIIDDENMGFSVIRTSDILSKGIDGIVSTIKNKIKDNLCYISIDIDVVDPAFAPGTGTPEPGGWSSLELLSILRKLKGLNIIGGDIVEVSPPYDKENITALLAATIAYDLLCLL